MQKAAIHSNNNDDGIDNGNGSIIDGNGGLDMNGKRLEESIKDGSMMAVAYINLNKEKFSNNRMRRLLKKNNFFM